MNYRLFICILITFFVIGNISAQQYDTITHTVQKNETIGKICEQYEMTASDFRSINNNIRNDLIIEGKKYKVLRKKDERKDQEPTILLNNESFAATSQANIKKTTDTTAKRREYKCEVCGKSFHTNNPIKNGRKKVCSDCKQTGSHNTLIMIIGLFVVFATVIWRMKFWDTIRIKKKECVFISLILLGILVTLLSWSVIRTLFVWLITISIIIAGCYFVIRKIQNKGKETVDKPYTNNTDALKRHLKELEKEIELLKDTNSKLKRKADALAKENKELIDENFALKERINDTTQPTPRKTTSAQSPSSTNEKFSKETVSINDENVPRKLYAEAIMDGVLMKVRENMGSDSIFELDLQNKDVASLSIIQSVYQRVLANSAYIEGCDKQITGNTTVKVTPGKVICNDQGKWIVLEKPVVIIS